MQKRLLPLSLLGLALVAATFLAVPGGAAALLLTAALSLIAIAVFRYFTEQKDFVTVLFLSALLLRLGFGLFVQIYDMRDFFGGDAYTYDFLGNEMYLRWMDQIKVPDATVELQLASHGSGWGMYYLVAAIYYVLGRNVLAAQSFCGVIGAATAPMVYFCAQRVYQNDRVARISTLFVAFCPAFIVWSGQLLKDGLMIFLLVLCMTMVIELQRRFSWPALLLLILSVAGVLPLRFYILAMLVPAVVGSFVIGLSTSPKTLVRNTIVLVIMGLGLTYLGVTRNASTGFDQYGSLAVLQNSRLDLSRSATSGFSSDVDISTTGGAISAIPGGLAYLMLAPFPWETASFRASITVPEVLLWWAMLPLMVVGIGWTLRNRLRRALPILIFSLMLTLAYSITQGNVGTAYRQRTQIQVFLFMFIAVGWTVRKEKQENAQILSEAQSRRIREHTRQLANARNQVT